MNPENINSVEGQISIKLRRNEKSSHRVEIISSRPVHAARILIGKTPEQALGIIPLLFNICGGAQSHAAMSCISQALQIEISTPMEQARDLLVLSENAKQHLLRVFLEWPKLFKLDINTHRLPYLSRLVTDFKTALFDQGQAFTLDSKLNKELSGVEILIDRLDLYLQEEVFCCPLQHWLDIHTIDDLRSWAEQSDCIAATTIKIMCEQGWTSQGLSQCFHLPKLNDSQLLARFMAEDAAQFIEQPDWQGKCYETTTLSRQQNHPLVQLLHGEFQSGLITRWVARLVELALIPQQMTELLRNIQQSDNKLSTQAKSEAIAQVEAARGRLIHRVEIEHHKISNYQILAPTEWNFHPQGLITQSLTHISAKDDQELQQLARLLINAIDPCVGYELRLI